MADSSSTRSNGSALISDTPELIEALREASGRDLLALLCRFGMAETFLRHLKERQIVFARQDLSSPDDIHQQAILAFAKDNNLADLDAQVKFSLAHSLSSSDFISEAIHSFRRKELKELLLNVSGETLYLRYKDKLDRVLYSLLRVDDPLLCQEIFYSIESSELSFGEASKQYSMGPESKTFGIVGPVDLTTPHPEVSARLRTAQMGHLIGPFEADNWHSIIRLEYRFDSEYDDQTKDFLREICFKSEIGKDIKEDLHSLTTWLASSIEN